MVFGAVIFAATAATAATTPSRNSPIRVACVGDSITAGYLASNAQHTYPGVLQELFDKKYGNGTHAVTNLGAGGATVQKDADSPYWKRAQCK